MKAGKITAKLRDAVKVHFVQEGHKESGKIYKNIDIPDELKKLEIEDFEFLIMGDKIEFELIFKKGTLPSVMPGNRPKVTRAEKAAAKVLAEAKATAEATVPKKIAPTAQKQNAATK